MSQIRFGGDKWELGLDELLTVREWAPTIVSRVSLFNTRTGEIDRQTRFPRLVVADGDLAFLKVLGNDLFNEADILAVIPRTLDRQRLEDIGARLSQLEQWYAHEPERNGILPLPPAGIAINSLKRVQ
ncbi:hypothetical protein [Noviherbaspirillum galbum]|uniref:Uncharacterized protein n=1 Tax=Noviherbaspirillum galbum TaxID=2709383 RepID=A0A6B3SNU9_9BURK|nr:hypothetical protein [Noviherbaspirillum galbum]NEX62474.1 hypothetical protein [Noviherbaspirillum galbum]